jgi:hypothetical protein
LYSQAIAQKEAFVKNPFFYSCVKKNYLGLLQTLRQFIGFLSNASESYAHQIPKTNKTKGTEKCSNAQRSPMI